jgi:HEAT repeat protein
LGAVVPLIIGCGSSTDDLIRDLSSENSRTRFKAAAALVGQQNRSATKKLILELDKNDDRLTFIVSQILGDLGDTTAVHPLGKVAKHANPHIRARALWSLGSIGFESGLTYLAEGLQDSVPMVRHAAVQGIGNMHYAPAARYLYPMLRDEADSIRTATIQSIYNFRRVAGSGVLAADLAASVNDPNQVVRYVAVQALGGGFPDTTVAGELLVESLRDENKDVRVEAIMSIRKIRYGEAIPVLKRIYDTATVDEEFAISEAIKEITGETFPSETGN